MSKKFRFVKLLASVSLVILGLMTTNIYSNNSNIVLAADNNFADGITVDSTGDGADANIADSICDDGAGNCTLRAAIEESNEEAGTQTIGFNISGPADFTNGGQNGYTIQPTSALPNLTDTVTIDGYTQPGSLANTAVAPNPLNGRLLIELDGSSAGGSGAFGDPSNVIALRFSNGSASSTARGLIVNEFTGSAFSVNAGADNVGIKGNYIGTDYSGLVAESNNGVGVNILGPTYNSGGPSNGAIGGSNPADRNVISGNDSTSSDPNLVIGVQGISITSGSPGWIIKGNYIGIGANGTSDIGNELGGITIDYVNDLTIGGPNAGDANVFSGNGDGGIQPDGCNNIVIQGNFIGTDYSGTVAVPNGHKGISALGTTNLLIGGVNNGEGNVIANAANGDPGIFLNNGTGIGGPLGYPQDVSILGNKILNNQGLGIDLAFNGVTSNDPLDSDSGPNDYLNYPEYTNITESGGDTTVDYRLDVPAGDYRIEFFSNTAPDPSGFGEGETYLGFANITHPGGGYDYFTHTLTGVTGVTNLAMTTTERNVATPSGFGATSEFSYLDGALPLADLSLAKTLTNPEDVAIGATLTYQFTFTNNGPETIDLADFTGATIGQNNLVNDIMPADITYASNVSNANVTCFSAGPGSAPMFGPALANHSDHELVFCNWTGPSQLLANGSSFSFTFDVMVQPTSDLVFNNYAFVPSAPIVDPDATAYGAIISSGQDILDLLPTSGINNFSRAQYPLPPEPTPSPTPATNTNTNSSNSLLAQTGQAVTGLAAVIALIGLSLLLITNRNHAHKK